MTPGHPVERPPTRPQFRPRGCGTVPDIEYNETRPGPVGRVTGTSTRRTEEGWSQGSWS